MAPLYSCGNVHNSLENVAPKPALGILDRGDVYVEMIFYNVCQPIKPAAMGKNSYVNKDCDKNRAGNL